MFSRVGAIEHAVVHVEGVRTFYRHRRGSGPPTVFVHGNPTDSEDFEPFMNRLEGPAVALDLPGWGCSEAPDPDRFDYSMWGLARFVERFREALGIGEHSLVVHDWGAVGLIAAQRRPQRLRRLVVINAVPLLPGYRWHWVARRAWRVPVLGEIANATTTRTSLRLLSRRGGGGGLPAALVDRVWATWPRGSRREPILRLYRSADPDRLAAAGERLGELECPALVLWGTGDPYLPLRFGRAYAQRLAAELVELEGAGHWPWLDRPEAVDRVTSFLSGEPR